MFSNKQLLLKVLTLSGISVLYIALLLLGPMLAPDSDGYISSSILRSPLYPLFLKFFRVVGGGSFSLYATSFMQLTLGFAAAFFLKTSFQRYFEMEKWASTIIFALLLTPYFGYSLIGNKIMSEALAYPIYLFTIAYLLRSLLESTNLNIVLFFIFVILLILTRTQFLFLIPFGILMLLYAHTLGKYDFTRSNKLLIALGLVSIIVAPNLLERSYNYMMHGRFITAPFLGLQLINLPLYIADEKDEEIFTDPLERGIFRDTYKKMHVKKITLDALDKTQLQLAPPATHFEYVYNEICWRSLSPTLGAYGISDPEKIDAITTKMAIRLILNNPIRYFVMYIRMFISGYGWYFGAFLLFLLTQALMAHWRYKDDISLITFTFVFLAFMNSTLIALVEPMLQRYTIYTNTTLLCWLIIFAALSLAAHKQRDHSIA